MTMTITGHMTYDAECSDCQANWITKRWGCHLLGVASPECPECGALDAVSHPDHCEFWHGSPAGRTPVDGGLARRFDDTEPYDPDYARLEPDDWWPSRSFIIGAAAVVVALIVLPTLPHGVTVAWTLLVIGVLVGAGAGLDAMYRRRRRLP